MPLYAPRLDDEHTLKNFRLGDANIAIFYERLKKFNLDIIKFDNEEDNVEKF